MASPHADLDQLTGETRNRLKTLRDAAKEAGVSHAAFYQTIFQYMSQYGTRASATWIREQCDPENDALPSIRKIYALKQSLDEYVTQTKNPLEPTQTPEGEAEEDKTDGEPRTAGQEMDEIEAAMYKESLEMLGKGFLEKPTRSVLIVAKLLNHAIDTHTKKGGHITPFIAALRARTDLAHNIHISNMPIHTLRGVHTLEHAKSTNPSFKTLAALAHTLLTFQTKNFPWGNDAAIEQDTKNILALIKEQRTKKTKKYPSLAEQNKAMIRGSRGTDVVGKKLIGRGLKR